MKRRKTLMEKVEALLEPAPLAHVPDAALFSEVQRRRNAMRKTRGAGTGRPPVMKTCAACGGIFPARQMRKHQCTGTGRINQ